MQNSLKEYNLWRGFESQNLAANNNNNSNNKSKVAKVNKLMFFLLFFTLHNTLVLSPKQTNVRRRSNFEFDAKVERVPRRIQYDVFICLVFITYAYVIL